jgi:serine/threonine protein kinase
VVVFQLSERVAVARRIGSYRLLERLGVGGMAEVWRAEHRMLARPAAVKIIRRSVLVDHGPEDAGGSCGSSRARRGRRRR